MAELDLTNIAAASIATPASGVTAVFVDGTNSPTKRLRTKDDAGTVITHVGLSTTDTGANRLQNKDLEDSTTNIVDETDTTKKIAFSAGGASTATVLTIADTQTTSQQLTIPNITATDTVVTTGLAQSVTGVKTLTNPTTLAGTNAVPSYTVTTGGTLMNTPTAGVQEADSAAFYNTLDTTNGRRYNDSWHFFRLTSNGSGITGIADFFGSNDGIPTVLNGVYEVEWHCYWVHTVTGTGTITWTIVNTQTVTNMVAEYVQCPIGGIGTVGAPQTAAVITQTNASVALPATAANTAIASHYAKVHALIEAGTAGNVRLRMTAGAGTATPSRDSFFKVRRLPAGNAGTFVA